MDKKMENNNNKGITDHDEFHNRNLIRTEEHLSISVNNDHSKLDALNKRQNPKIEPSNSKSTKSDRIYSGLKEDPRLQCKKAVNQINNYTKPLIKNNQKIMEQKNEILSRTFDLLKIKKLIKTFFYFILILLIFNSQFGVESAPVKTNETSLINLNQELITNNRTFSYYNNNHMLTKRQTKGKKQKKIINKNCKEYDITSRAYLADLIFEGTARSRSSSTSGRYDVTFVIQRILKQNNNILKPKSQIRLHFGGKASRKSSNPLNDCPIFSITNNSKIANTNVKVGGKYYVFAERFGPMNYTAKGEPIVNNRRNLKSIKSVISRNRDFLIPEKPPRVRGLHDVNLNLNSALRLNCQVKGRPVPRITWYKDGRELIPSSYINITYYRKNSTLEIKSTGLRDRGRYECRATNVKGRVASMSAYVNISAFYIENTTSSSSSSTSTTTDSDWPSYAEKCQVEEFCLNDGKCFFIPSIGEHMCICKVGYKGARCENKEVTGGGITSYFCNFNVGYASYYC